MAPLLVLCIIKKCEPGNELTFRAHTVSEKDLVVFVGLLLKGFNLGFQFFFGLSVRFFNVKGVEGIDVKLNLTDFC